VPSRPSAFQRKKHQSSHRVAVYELFVLTQLLPLYYSVWCRYERQSSAGAHQDAEANEQEEIAHRFGFKHAGQLWEAIEERTTARWMHFNFPPLLAEDEYEHDSIHGRNRNQKDTTMKQARIKQTKKGQWFGYVANKKTASFADEEQAKAWLLDCSGQDLEDYYWAAVEHGAEPYEDSPKWKAAQRERYNRTHREPQAHGDDGMDYGPLPDLAKHYARRPMR
jgi:hypothetical protein